MFHPVGNQPSSVYWRRRLLLGAGLVVLLVLIVLTLKAVTSDASGPTASGKGTGPVTPASGTPADPTSSSSSGQGTHHKHHGGGNPTTDSVHSSTAPNGGHHPSGTASSDAPQPCVAKDLTIAAAVGKSHYQVGDTPKVMIEVTNDGADSCVQELGDPQIVLKIFNGESRVWGSHDCTIEHKTVDRTLMAGQTVRLGIVWTGFTSTPGCGDRQRVGAGIYTLDAWLQGHEGTTTQFSMS